MALWQRLGLESKAARPAASASATSHALSVPGGGSRFAGLNLDQDNVEAVVNGHYKRVVLVFRCVDAIAQAQASLPMHVYETRDVGAKQVEGYDDVERLLNQRPNRYETAWQFRYRVSTLLLLSSMGVFVEKVPDKDIPKRTAELHIIAPDACQPIKDAKRYVSGYRVRTDDGGFRDLPPDKVIWIRGRPHPTDPWKQVTPLQAAGLAADTDFLAHIFNTNWLRNDGRVAQLIGIKADQGMDPADVDAIKQMFGGGVGRAGETRVVEADALSVAQVGGAPSDAQYGNLLTASGKEIKLAYGTSDTFLGDASMKTFDNADAEDESTWLKTMPAHCNPIAEAFEVLLDNGDDPGLDADVIRHDFTGVPQMQRAARLKADRMLAEAQGGFRTWDSYFEETGQEPWDVPATRVLWTPVGPIGRDEKDTQAARDMVAANRPPTPTLPGMTDPSGGAVPGAQPPVGALPPGGQRPAAQSDLNALAGKLRSVVNDRAAETQRGQAAIAGAKARLQASPERKTTQRARAPRPPRRPRGDVVDAEIVGEQWHDEHPSEALVKTLEADLARALGGVCRRMLGAVDGRLQSTKTRKGTRHWETPPGVEVKIDRQLREFYIAQVERWGNETAAETGFLIRNAASRSMAEIRPILDLDAPALLLASRLVREMVNRLSDDLRQGVERRVRDIAKLIRSMDDAGASIEDIKEAVAARQATLDRWVEQVVPRVARAAVQGARAIMIDRVSDSQGVKVWITMHDDRVRHEHVAADGQVAKRGHGFLVGGHRMAFPGDPRVPPSLWAGCRCSVGYRRADGKTF